MAVAKRRVTLGGALVLYALTILLGSVLYSVRSNAEAACDIQGTPFTGITSLAQGTYDVYAKLEMSGAPAANVTVFTSKGNSDCKTIGTAEATSDMWQKVGSANVNDAAVQFNLIADGIVPTYQYDRPSLLLISQTNPACQPNTDCPVTVNGESASLQLTATTPDSGTLRLYAPNALTTASIKKVEYYADGVLMYKTDALQAFSPDSIPYNAHIISRVITFSDGQSAVIEQELPTANADSLGAMFTRTARKYQLFLVWIAAMALLVALYYIVRALAYRYKAKRDWRYAHGFIKGTTIKAPKPSLMTRLYGMGPSQRITTGIGVLAVIAIVGLGIIMLLDSFVIQVNKVKDAGMGQTLPAGNQAVIDKTGATFALLNQSNFVPQRGDIIAAHSARADIRNTTDDTLIFRRVIGLPGERVVVNGAEVIVFNTEHPNGFDPAEGTSWKSSINKSINNQLVDMQLKTNELFVLGDNRPSSLDSRQEGPLPLKNIVGVVRTSFVLPQ